MLHVSCCIFLVHSSFSHSTRPYPYTDALYVYILIMKCMCYPLVSAPKELHGSLWSLSVSSSISSSSFLRPLPCPPYIISFSIPFLGYTSLYTLHSPFWPFSLSLSVLDLILDPFDQREKKKIFLLAPPARSSALARRACRGENNYTGVKEEEEKRVCRKRKVLNDSIDWLIVGV